MPTGLSSLQSQDKRKVKGSQETSIYHKTVNETNIDQHASWKKQLPVSIFLHNDFIDNCAFPVTAASFLFCHIPWSSKQGSHEQDTTGELSSDALLIIDERQRIDIIIHVSFI